MNKFILPAILIASIMIPSVCYGQSIQTGNASAKSTVETDVQGSGNVHTVIQVEANGEKKTLDTTEPGTHTLEVNSNENETNKIIEDGKIKATPSATITPKVKNMISNRVSKTNSGSFLNGLKNFFSNLFRNIGLKI